MRKRLTKKLSQYKEPDANDILGGNAPFEDSDAPPFDDFDAPTTSSSATGDDDIPF